MTPEELIVALDRSSEKMRHFAKVVHEAQVETTKLRAQRAELDAAYWKLKEAVCTNQSS